MLSADDGIAFSKGCYLYQTNAGDAQLFWNEKGVYNASDNTQHLSICEGKCPENDDDAEVDLNPVCNNRSTGGTDDGVDGNGNGNSNGMGNDDDGTDDSNNATTAATTRTAAVTTRTASSPFVNQSTATTTATTTTTIAGREGSGAIWMQPQTTSTTTVDNDTVVILKRVRIVAAGAQCFDGSNAFFYFKKAPTEEGMRNWVFYLPGGGWCTDDVECTQGAEATPDLFSSNAWGDTVSFPQGSVLNPYSTDDVPYPIYTGGANLVFLRYCTADGYTGNASLPAFNGNSERHYRGSHVFHSMLDQIILDPVYGIGNYSSGSAAAGAGAGSNDKTSDGSADDADDADDGGAAADGAVGADDADADDSAVDADDGGSGADDADADDSAVDADDGGGGRWRKSEEGKKGGKGAAANRLPTFIIAGDGSGSQGVLFNLNVSF